MKKIIMPMVLAAVLLGLASGAGALEKGLMWNGSHWAQVSLDAKSAYVFGLGNLADFETAGSMAAQGSACVSRALVTELKNKTVEQVVKEVDRFYQDNPDKLKTTVIEVVLRETIKACMPQGEAKK